jgi:hypothetical protein
MHIHLHVPLDPRLDQIRDSLTDITDILTSLRIRIGLLMAGQEDIDAAVAAIGADVTALEAASVRIMDEIAQLEAAGVNTDGLMAAVNAWDVATGKIVNIVPEPVDPPVDPTPVVVVDPEAPVEPTLAKRKS